MVLGLSAGGRGLGLAVSEVVAIGVVPREVRAVVLRCRAISGTGGSAACGQQVVRQGYSRGYLTTGFRQPEAVALYLGHGYTPLFDLAQDPATIGSLPFQKLKKSMKVDF